MPKSYYDHGRQLLVLEHDDGRKTELKKFGLSGIRYGKSWLEKYWDGSISKEQLNTWINTGYLSVPVKKIPADLIKKPPKPPKRYKRRIDPEILNGT